MALNSTAFVLTPDGQTAPVDRLIAENDDALRLALGTIYPEVGTAIFTREEIGDRLMVRVTPRAATKG